MLHVAPNRRRPSTVTCRELRNAPDDLGPDRLRQIVPDALEHQESGPLERLVGIHAALHGDEGVVAAVNEESRDVELLRRRPPVTGRGDGDAGDLARKTFGVEAAV